MPLDFNTNTENNDEWLTPPPIIKALGMFDLDPCSPINRPWDTAKTHYSKKDNGLIKPWFGRVWCNPPYGNYTFEWIQKLSEHSGGGVGLIAARTETKGFQYYVFQRAHSLFFFKGRVNFYTVAGDNPGRSNFPSALISYTELDTESIANANLDGSLVLLSNDYEPVKLQQELQLAIDSGCK
jgi:hypothetical protein